MMVQVALVADNRDEERQAPLGTPHTGRAESRLASVRRYLLVVATTRKEI